MPTMKSLAEELGTDTETLRQGSNVRDVTDEQDLTPLQEQNLRGTWASNQALNTTVTPAPAESDRKTNS